MCQFISTVEKDGKVYFLNHEQIYDSPRGDAMRKWNPVPEDWIGHGAIRFYYNIVGGENDIVGGVDKEYTDFSSPDNFPAVIVKAIKAGEFRGLACPRQLLAFKDYQAPTMTAFWDLFADPANRAEAWR